MRTPIDGDEAAPRREAINVAMFDYKGADGRALVAEAYDLAIYYSNGAPQGWRALTAQELGVDPSHVDPDGYFRGTSLPGAQAHVLGKFDGEGRLIRLSIAFTATNDANDPGDYGAMDDDSYANDFDYLLDAVRAYAPPRGLDGSDVIVTGYSLGAGAANTMAAQRDTSWGGFYATSDYIGVAVPKLTEVADVLNFGFENDVVHRIVGEGDADDQADNPLHGVLHNDRLYETSTDNVVLFNDMYVVGGFEAVPITLGDIPRGWAAHIDIPDENFVRRIGGSTFYEHIERDSPVVIAFLTAQLAAITWVEDKRTVTSDHFGRGGFVLGSAGADRLGDGTGGDFLDGFAGDDVFRLSGGDDRVHGGEGTDTVQLSGALGDYDIVRTRDGVLHVLDRSGGNGIETLASVERLTTRALGAEVYVVTSDGLRSPTAPNIDYAVHRDGGEGGDVLTAAALGERLFGLNGDDVLVGGAGADWLNGGAGRDSLGGGGGADVLDGFDGADTVDGGAGDDVLRGGRGDDVVLGGAGADTLVYAGHLSLARVVVRGTSVALIGEDGSDRVFGVETFRFAERTIARDAADGIDDLWYLATYRDVAGANMDADTHFNSAGRAEGRNPNAFFDRAYYLQSNPDVAAAGVDPWLHYLGGGWREGRDPSAAFSVRDYLQGNPDVAASGENPLIHYLRLGMDEGRARNALLDEAFYLAGNPDVDAALVDPYLHWLSAGRAERRDPNAWFDADGYLATYTDVAAAGIDPLTHYLSQGWLEGRDPSTRFDTTDYLAANPDVAALQINPLLHWLITGRTEGRASFDDGVWG